MCGLMQRFMPPLWTGQFVSKGRRALALGLRAQSAPNNLARCGEGKRVHKSNFARIFMRG